MAHIYSGILLDPKKNEILPFVATWMDLEGITLSEISQRKTNTVLYHLYEESKIYNKLVNITKKRSRLTDIGNKLVVTHGERGEGQYRMGEWEVQTNGCKVGSRMYWTTQGIETIFCNSYKWKITFKIVQIFFLIF